MNITTTSAALMSTITTTRPMRAMSIIMSITTSIR